MIKIPRSRKSSKPGRIRRKSRRPAAPAGPKPATHHFSAVPLAVAAPEIGAPRMRVFKEVTNKPDPEDELDWKAGQLWPTMASSIEPAEIEAETFLARQPDLDSIARKSATALQRRDAALRHIEQRRSRRTKEEAQSQKIAATRSMNGKGEGPLVEPTPLEELPIAADRNHQNGHG